MAADGGEGEGGGEHTHTHTLARMHTHIHTHALQMCCEHQLDLTSSSKSSVNHETTKSSDRKNIETVLDQENKVYSQH